MKIMSLVLLFKIISNGLQLTGEKSVHLVEFHMIPYAMIMMLRWRTSPAQKEATYCTRVYVQSDHWTGSVSNYSTCDLVYLHRFLPGYIVIFKISTHAEVVAYSMMEWHYSISMWCVLTHTWILHLSSRYDPVWHHIVSCISNKLFSKLRHLVSYVSCHCAMACDTGPHKWSYRMWKLCGKKPNLR